MRDLVVAGQWQEADEAPGAVMLKIARRVTAGFNEEDIQEFGSIQFWKIYKFWENVRRDKKCASATMNQDKQERIKACLQELATLLYEEADKSQLTDLEGI